MYPISDEKNNKRKIPVELKNLFRQEARDKINERCSELNNGAFFLKCKPQSEKAINFTIIRRMHFLTEAPLPAWVSLIRNIIGERRSLNV